MELLTPDLGLIIFQIIILINIVFFIGSWVVILINDKIKNKIAWMMGTLFLPIIGPAALLFYLIKTKK
jgi:hypothetical protein